MLPPASLRPGSNEVSLLLVLPDDRLRTIEVGAAD
jgi:hypothetical protein